MTTIFEKQVTCAVCGETHEQRLIGSTNAFGSPDLDLRPPEMQRSTMSLWLQRCPSCGYCAPDLARLSAGAAEVVASDGYRATLGDERYPELARRFLASALLSGGDRRAAARARLHAAWACDDQRGAEALAVACRALAIEDSRSGPFPDSEGGVGEGAILVDILRRVSRFSEAIELIDALLGYEQSRGVIEQVLRFQRRLCEAGDAGCYRVSDATAS